jgi:hypothetical protein
VRGVVCAMAQSWMEMANAQKLKFSTTRSTATRSTAACSTALCGGALDGGTLDGGTAAEEQRASGTAITGNSFA